MIIKPIQCSTNMLSRRSLAIACVFSSVFLASCGGGSDGTSSTESADGMQQAQGVTTSTGTVPGGWKGRAPKMEVINGITVPPEPAPAVNNANLAGVDVNANGVRDDVERVVALHFSKAEPTEKSSALAVAKLAQSALTSTGDSQRKNAFLMGCAFRTMSDLQIAILRQSIFNTSARRDLIRPLLSSTAANINISTIDSDCSDAIAIQPLK